MRDPGSITYSAAIESAAAQDANPARSDFAERVLREATRRNFTKAPRCAVLGDGSAWIWNTAKELFPQAIQILDRYHVKETLHRTAQAIFGATSQEAKPWAMARCTELDDGKLSAILHALRPHISAPR
jgi:Transposase